MQNGRNAPDKTNRVTPLHRGSAATHPDPPWLKVIAYVRVSTNEQAENGVSLAAQEQKLRAHCKGNGWHCVGIVRDDGYSAKDLKPEPIADDLNADRIPTKNARRWEAFYVGSLDPVTRPKPTPKRAA